MNDNDKYVTVEIVPQTTLATFARYLLLWKKNLTKDEIEFLKEYMKDEL
jgi:hypothetical protein